MGKITIEISVKDGKLYYKDSEDNQGSTITTHAKSGDKIIWIAAEDSEIKDLTGINITGTTGYFKKGPSKKGQKKWKATIGKIDTGEIDYYIFYDNTTSPATKSLIVDSNDADELPPKIKTP